MPTAPRNLEYREPVITGNMFNITLTWSRPDPPNGIITQYNVSDILVMAIVFKLFIAIGILYWHKLRKFHYTKNNYE